MNVNVDHNNYHTFIVCVHCTLTATIGELEWREGTTELMFTDTYSLAIAIGCYSSHLRLDHLQYVYMY